MDSNGDIFWEEYCCSDGKENRCRNVKTLSASVYFRLLQKQVAVAVMECNSEDKDYIWYF